MAQVKPMDRAYWISWYDLADAGRDAYLEWAHAVYIPKVLERPGVLWGAHYASEPASSYTPLGGGGRINREIVTAIQQPDVSARLAKEGVEGVGTAPREFAAHLKFEHETWVRVIKRAGIRAE